MDLRVGVSAVVMNWLILLYFIILFAERVQSIVRSIRDKDYCAIIGLNQKDLETQGILA